MKVEPVMNAPRKVLSLSLSLLAGLLVAACDGQDESTPMGRACELAGESLTCDDGNVAYCGYSEVWEAQEWYGELSYGPCIAPEEIECEPGDFRHEGPEPNQEEGEVCAGTDYRCEVVGGEPMWVEQLCNTPLLLRFDAAPIEMIAAEATPAATFDINMQADSCISTDWPTAATPWLVVDLDQNGTIDGGHELFGSGSRLATGDRAEHGFAALAEFDHNGDGVVDGADPRFAELMLWRDWDADRVSTPDELEPLASAGVDRLALDYLVAPECDERGNCGMQRAGFEHAGGVGQVVDVYLPCR